MARAEVRITATENGPYKVQGPVELLDQSGKPVELRAETVFLCRCGASSTKPFCDGTHSKIGFQGAMQAVAESETG